MRMYNEQYVNIYNTEGQNNFSLNLFQKFMEYSKENNIIFNNHLDMACGTGVFCLEMINNGVKSQGIDLSESMIAIANENAQKQNVKITFEVGNMVDYSSSNKYDLITCNYDAINHLLSFNEWILFFENVYKNLNNGGYFLFDFNTIKKLENFDIINYNKKNDNYDEIIIAAPINDYQILFRLIYYVKESNGLYKKISESIIESVFENQKIVDNLNKCGFKLIQIFNRDFKECDVTEASNRLYVLCQK